MSIANNLQASVTKLRAIIRRGNGDIFEVGPAILDGMEQEIARVRGLEGVTVINTDLLKEFQEKGGINGTASN
jgi:hypothetical protein